MAELKHRLAALHPEARYLEVVICLGRIDTEHEALALAFTEQISYRPYTKHTPDHLHVYLLTQYAISICKIRRSRIFSTILKKQSTPLTINLFHFYIIIPCHFFPWGHRTIRFNDYIVFFESSNNAYDLRTVFLFFTTPICVIYLM